MGEGRGNNLQSVLSNDSVSHYDYFGLEAAKWYWTDGLPGTLRGVDQNEGETKVELWEAHGTVEKCAKG